MLTELRIKDFVLIEDTRIEMTPGLVVLTGETGAGKSIVIDALSLVLGARSSGNLVRKGKKQARVEARFEVQGNAEIEALLEEAGLPDDEDYLTITRTIAADGKTRVHINGSPTTVAVLKRLGDHLIDIHGQHEHQSLLRKSVYIDLLDDYAGLADQRAKVGEQYRRRESIREELHELRTHERERRRREDLLRYQIREIGEAGLVHGEEQELDSERAVLRNVEKMVRAASHAYQLLSEPQDETTSILDQLAEVAHQLNAIAAIDRRMEPVNHELEEAMAALQDVAQEVSAYAEDIEHSPQRLEEVEDRLILISQLKSKYGASLGDVLAFLEEAETELAAIESSDEQIEQLEKERETLETQLAKTAQELSDKRKKAAGKLGKAVAGELEFLGMKGAKFAVSVDQKADEEGVRLNGKEAVAVGPKGIDDVDFQVAVNPGQDLRPLREAASGGEISRIMLALKSVFAEVDPVPVMVFDEIDQGVGGTVADCVGKRMAELARHRQILCITHLAPIASRSDLSLAVRKETSGKEALTTVKRLAGEDREREIARMLGDEDSEHSRRYARELLDRTGKG